MSRSDVPNQQAADVVIAGAGIASTACAIALLGSGIRPLVLASPRPHMSMVEAIPCSAIPLFEAIGIQNVLRKAASIADQLHNSWRAENPVIRHDLFLLVDRLDLAQAMLREASMRGAVISEMGSGTCLRSEDRRVLLEMGGVSQEFEAAIDATGRSAIWSRPVTRIRHIVADIFNGPAMGQGPLMKIVRRYDGWDYLVGSRHNTTLGRMRSPANAPTRDLREIPAEMKIDPSGFKFAGRRPAFVQWAEEPVAGRRLAIGDAAISHDPISGQGIRFALGSALNAAAVVRTWRRASEGMGCAAEFYREFVATERRRHVAALASLYGNSLAAQLESVWLSPSSKAERSASEVEASLPRELRFTATIERGGISVSGFIERSDIIRLNDGGVLRWLGGFDLLKLRDLAGPGVYTTDLLEQLARDRLTTAEAINMLRWCMAKRILAPLVR